jgi:hypothetical protein
VDYRFGGDGDVSVAGGACDEGACACSGCSADGEAYAASGETADQHACAGHAADEACCALAFTLLGADTVMRVERVLGAVKGHGGEAKFEDGCALKVAAAMGLVDASADGCAARNDDGAAVLDDGLYDFAAEVITSTAIFDADVPAGTVRENGPGAGGGATGAPLVPFGEVLL